VLNPVVVTSEASVSREAGHPLKRVVGFAEEGVRDPNDWSETER